MFKESNKSNEKSLSKSKPKAASPNPPQGDRGAKKELQKQQRIFQQLEEKITTLTDEKIKLEAALSDPATYSDKQKFLQAETSYNKAASELQQLNKQYEQVFEKIVELESTQN